ncbi:MAG: DUF2868 domain-containing protein [Proteobacteria bacterium]|nr:DUF2868 domain-containing protein [Pseudomonadota bacterium]
MKTQTVATSDSNSSSFDRRLLIEQVRYIESATSLDCDIDDVSSDHPAHSDFEQRLWQRARSQIRHCDLSQALGRAEKLSGRVHGFALLIAALSGAFGTVLAITDVHTINIYWLLLILLGFNLLSMFFWLVGISMNMRGSATGVLGTALLSVINRQVNSQISSQINNQINRRSGNVINEQGSSPVTDTRSTSKIITQADRAWLAANFSGAVGKWQLSKIPHQLWLTYLLSGLIFLVLLLMLRQYDFVWGTTLLSDSAFLKLTDMVSAPLNALGFSTPSAEQVRDTRIGAAQILSAEHRYNWAQFLIGTLLCFGILPRVLLWLWSALMSVYARRQYTLDYYLPYYIRLRQQLVPLASHGQIVDADDSPPGCLKPDGREQTTRSSAASSSPRSLPPSPHELPDGALWVAVELGGNISWPPAAVRADDDLGQVTDRESMVRIQQQLQSKTDAVIAVAVSSARPPDRGVQRTISQLLADAGQRWLVLLSDGQETVSDARMAAWYRLAETCRVPADHVIAMSVARSEES